MNVAILSRPNDPLSLRLYGEHMCRELSVLGIEITPIKEHELPPNYCDILWDPAMCMRSIPSVLYNSKIPVVITMHGVKAFSMNIEEIAINERHCAEILLQKKKLYNEWMCFKKTVSAIVAVSDYAALEVANAFHLQDSLIHTIYNGLDHSVFKPEGDVFKPEGDVFKPEGDVFKPEGDVFKHDRPYYLCVARIDPIKNLERIISAYKLLPEENRHSLILLATPDDEQLEYVELRNHYCKFIL